MGKFEKPLTWGLVILLLGYLFVANCECGEGSTCPLNNEVNIESQETDVLNNDAEAGTVVVRVTKDDGDTIDSVITYGDSTEVEEEIEVVKVEDSE
jgi:hypothetical protein